MIEKPEEIFEGVVAQKAIITDGKRVLLVKGLGADRWDLPGGRLHKNEVPTDGLLRELKEETGCDFEIGPVVVTSQMYHESVGKWAYFIAYSAKFAGDSEITIPEDELEECRWFQENEISPEMIWDNCYAAISEYFKSL